VPRTRQSATLAVADMPSPEVQDADFLQHLLLTSEAGAPVSPCLPSASPLSASSSLLELTRQPVVLSRRRAESFMTQRFQIAGSGLRL
jgi:hypothetical protein